MLINYINKRIIIIIREQLLNTFGCRRDWERVGCVKISSVGTFLSGNTSERWTKLKKKSK